MKTRQLTLEDLNISVIASDEDIHPREHLSESTLTEAEIDAIYEEAVTSNIWKWCTVEVKAEYKGLEASDYLGACSYENEEEFKKDGYYTDMCQTVLADLQKQLDSFLEDIIC